VCRSTLRYRLRRIRELTGCDLAAIESRLNLHVASRAWRMGPGWDCSERPEADAAVLDLLLLLRLRAGTLLEVAGEGTDHALLTQTDDGGVRAPRACSPEVGSGAAHPPECRWLG
jgi:hypothetical protein